MPPPRGGRPSSTAVSSGSPPDHPAGGGGTGERLAKRTPHRPALRGRWHPRGGRWPAAECHLRLPSLSGFVPQRLTTPSAAIQARNENNGRDVFILQQILKITPGFGLEGVFGPLRPPDISLPNSLPNWGRGRPARGPGRKTMETHISVAIRTFLIPIAGEPPAPPVWLRTSHVLPPPARTSVSRKYLQSDCKFIPPTSPPPSDSPLPHRIYH